VQQQQQQQESSQIEKHDMNYFYVAHNNFLSHACCAVFHSFVVHSNVCQQHNCCGWQLWEFHLLCSLFTRKSFYIIKGRF